MGKILLFTFILLFGQSAFSQTVKLIGFKQEVSPGIVTGNDNNENGQPQKERKPGPNYYIYLVSKAKIIPVEMWIEGILYSVKHKTITKTPVEVANNDLSETAKKTTLVAKTTNQVVQLLPVPAMKKGNSAAEKASATKNLVVRYKLNGKFYTATLQDFTLLEPQTAM